MIRYTAGGKEVRLLDRVTLPGPWWTFWAKEEGVVVEVHDDSVAIRRLAGSTETLAHARPGFAHRQLRLTERGPEQAPPRPEPPIDPLTSRWEDPSLWDPYWRSVLLGAAERRARLVERDAYLSLASLRDMGAFAALPGKGRLLEAGCGISLEPHLFAYLGFDVTAIDLSPAAIAHNAANRPSEEDLARCLRWRLDETRGDQLIFIEEPGLALAQLRHIRRPGGRCRFQVSDWFDRTALQPGSFDVVVCLNGVRCSPQEMWEKSLLRFHELLAPDGLLVLSNLNALELLEVIPPLCRAAGFHVAWRGETARPADRRTVFLEFPTG